MIKPEHLYILIGCEESQAICIEFRKLGFNAFSCDLKECSGGHPEWHLQIDVFEAIKLRQWDLGIFHPECTYMTVSGLHRNKNNPIRAEKTEQSLIFVKMLLDADIQHIALENPVGCISSRIRKPNQIIQPYQFGDDASKSTCLWTKDLPLLKHTKYIEPRIVNGKKRWANQTDDGQNKLVIDGKWIGYNDPRTKTFRSKTYQGVAHAIARQWGKFLSSKTEHYTSNFIDQD